MSLAALMTCAEGETRGETRDEMRGDARDEMPGEMRDERRGEMQDETRSSVSGGGRMGKWWIACPRRWLIWVIMQTLGCCGETTAQTSHVKNGPG